MSTVDSISRETEELKTRWLSEKEQRRRAYGKTMG
jgi:hypothetical protein